MTKELRVPASPIRRPRLAATLVGAVLAVALLGGCAGQRTPGSYTSSVGKDFVEGCVATTIGDAEEGAIGANGRALADDALKDKFPEQYDAASTSCRCAYKAIKKDVKFSTFKEIDDDQIDDPSKLPASFTKAFADCNG